MQTTLRSERRNWAADDRSGLNRNDDGNEIERLISVPLDPEDHDKGVFDLYYFVYKPKSGRTTKTVLFCSGGPGDFVRGPDYEETYADFLQENGYNVVLFHLRGCGFSQLPPSNDIDRFLKTSCAVADLEAIRHDLLGESGKWDAIIARSYGTILAQQYAYYYAEKVKKVVLVAPMSRHKFNNSPDAFDEFYKDVVRIHRQSIEAIYNSENEAFSNAFFDLTQHQKETIVKTLFGKEDADMSGIFQRAEHAFGSIQYIVDAYCELQRKKDELGGKSELEEYGLACYSRKFFRKLRQLRLYGSFTEGRDSTRNEQVEIGETLRDEILYNKKAEDECPDEHVQGSHRTFYVTGFKDGVHPRFLDAWFKSGKSDVSGALRSVGGVAHLERCTNRWIESVGVTGSEIISPWDPRRFRHDVPTLILKGGGDPVTADGQAEYVFEYGLIGHRILIVFPGVGHEFSFPVPDEAYAKPIFSGTARIDCPTIPAGGVRSAPGRVNGRTLNGGLHLEVKPPPRIADGLHVFGVSVNLAKYGIAKTVERQEIVALIENTGSDEVDLGGTEWSIQNKFFFGVARFTKESRIPPRQIRAVYGYLVSGGRNKEREFKVEAVGRVEESLKLLGYSIERDVNEFLIKLFIINEGSTDTEADTSIRIKVSRGTFIESFRVTFPMPKPQQVAVVNISPRTLDVDENDILHVVLGEHKRDLLAAIAPQEGGTQQIPIIIRNQNEEKFEKQTVEWIVESLTFSIDVTVDIPDIPSRGGVIAYGTIKNLLWKSWIDIERPSDLGPDLSLVGFNIEDKNALSLFLENTGTEDLKGDIRDWYYVDPHENSECACLRCENVLSCLIYTFLTMNPDQFSNVKDNKILQILKDMFRISSLGKHCIGDGIGKCADV